MSQRKLKKLRKEVSTVDIGNNSVEVLEKKGIIQILKENWVFVAVICFLLIVFYANSLTGDFVSDDYATIPNNPGVASFSEMIRTMPNLVNGTNTVIAMMFGVGSSLPYHFFNFLIYVVVCVMVFVFVYLLMNKNVAYISTIIFAVMPIHVESVSWISGRPYSLSTMFMMFALCGFLLYLRKKTKNYIVLVIVAMALAALTDKVRFMSFFLVVIGYSLTFWKRENLKIGKVIGIILGLFIISFIVLSKSILARIGIVNSGYNSSESIFYDPFFQYPTAIPKYLQLMFIPTDLTLYHTMYVFPVWLNWAVFMSYLSCVGYFFFKNKNIFYSLVFIFLAMAPSMAPVKVSWLVAERYAFMGSIGFAMFLALILDDLYKYSKYLVGGLVALLVVSYGIRTLYRNDDWSTNHKLWVNTCQVSPNSHNAWNNIGDDYDKLKEYDNAVKGFTQSTIVKPNYADAYHNRANIFYKTGRLDLARDSYNTAIYYSPGLYQTYLSLVQIDMSEGKYDLAVEQATKAYQIQPDNPQSAYVLGVVKAQVGQLSEAKEIMKTLVARYPGFDLAKNALIQLNSATVGATRY